MRREGTERGPRESKRIFRLLFYPPEAVMDSAGQEQTKVPKAPCLTPTKCRDSGTWRIFHCLLKRCASIGDLLCYSAIEVISSYEETEKKKRGSQIRISATRIMHQLLLSCLDPKIKQHDQIIQQKGEINFPSIEISNTSIFIFLI